MNTNFKVIGLTRLRIKRESTAPETDALSTRSSQLFWFHDCVLGIVDGRLDQEQFHDRLPFGNHDSGLPVRT